MITGSDTGVKPEQEELIQKVRGGDLSAFSALVMLYEERMIHTAYSFLTNWEDAREAAQDAFVKVYRAIGQFKGDSQFSTWIYSILVNQCKDRLRKRKVRKNILVRQTQNETDTTPAEEKVATYKDSGRELLDQELSAKIHAALEKLPFQQRSAFILRYLENRSLEETAQAMNLSLGAVKAHLWQAAQKVKKDLAYYLKG